MRNDITRDELEEIVSTAVGDLKLDLIGYDSCVMAVRRLYDLCHEKGVEAKPLGCVSLVKLDDPKAKDIVTVVLCDDDPDTGEPIPGHAILKVGRFIVDLTLNQAREISDRIPEIGPLVYALPDKYPVPTSFSTEVSTSGNSVTVTYAFDEREEPYYLDTADWNMRWDTVKEMLDAFSACPKTAELFRQTVQEVKPKTRHLSGSYDEIYAATNEVIDGMDSNLINQAVEEHARYERDKRQN